MAAEPYDDLSQADEAAIGDLVQRYFGYACDGNWHQWVEHCSEDILVLPPGAAQISGREAARRWLETLPSIGTISGGPPKIRGSGRFAFATGTVLVTNGTADDVQPAYTKWLAVYEKDESGEWAMVADIWNDHPASED